MSINKNLRELRLSRNMTQEDVAEKIGLTRQAISSYESGRTRPDIDMLMRLAEIYGTDLEGVLYGASKEQKAFRTLKSVAIAALGTVLLLILASSALLWTANYLVYIPSGTTVTDELRPLLDTRFSLVNAHTAFGSVALTVSLIGAAVLLVLLYQRERLIAVKYKLLYIGVLAAGLAVCTLPFAFSDQVYGPVDYLIYPINTLAAALVFLAASIVLDFLRKQMRKKRQAESNGAGLKGTPDESPGERKAFRNLKITAIAVLVAALLLTLVSAVLLWIAGYFFRIPTGMVADEVMPLLTTRLSLINAHARMISIATVVLFLGAIVLLVLLFRQERLISIKYKLLYMAVLAAGMAICTLPFAFADQVYGPADYFPIETLLAALSLWAASIVLDFLRKQIRKKRQSKLRR